MAIIFIVFATSLPRYEEQSKVGNTYGYQTNRQIQQRDKSDNTHDPGVVARELGDRDHGFGLCSGALCNFLKGIAVGVEDGVIAVVENFVELF